MEGPATLVPGQAVTEKEQPEVSSPELTSGSQQPTPPGQPGLGTRCAQNLLRRSPWGQLSGDSAQPRPGTPRSPGASRREGRASPPAYARHCRPPPPSAQPARPSGTEPAPTAGPPRRLLIHRHSPGPRRRAPRDRPTAPDRASPGPRRPPARTRRGSAPSRPMASAAPAAGRAPPPAPAAPSARPGPPSAAGRGGGGRRRVPPQRAPGPPHGPSAPQPRLRLSNHRGRRVLFFPRERHQRPYRITESARLEETSKIFSPTMYCHCNP